MRPGTRPKTEYEYGKDMIAKQMYSEKRSADVCRRYVSQLSADLRQEHGK